MNGDLLSYDASAPPPQPEPVHYLDMPYGSPERLAAWEAVAPRCTYCGCATDATRTISDRAGIRTFPCCGVCPGARARHQEVAP